MLLDNHDGLGRARDDGLSSALLLDEWCRRDGVAAEWTIPASVALAGMTRLACE